MRVLSCLLLQLVFHLISTISCIGGNIVIRQSRTRNLIEGEGTWQVIGVATVQLNNYYTFLCTTGDDGAILRWYAANNFTVISQSSHNAGQVLTINSVEGTDIGEYICRDTVGGSEARLNLTTDNPALRAAEPTVIVEEGQRANLIVYVSQVGGRDTSRIRWYKGRVGITSNLYDSSTRLTFENVQLSDAGVYNVTKTIELPGAFFTTIRVVITLIVYVRPVLVSNPPMSLPVNEWTTTHLECRFTGYPRPQVTWDRNNGPISGEITSTAAGDNEITSRLTLTDVTVEDAGQYQCTGSVSVAGIAVTHNTNISVTARILFFQTDTSTVINGSVLIVEPRESLIVLCRSSGLSHWHAPNGLLVSTDTSGAVHQRRVDDYTLALNIMSYNISHSGRYSCSSELPGNVHIHRNVTLTTDNPLVYSDNDSLIYARSGETLRLVVYILGDPVPRVDQISWYRNGTRITMQDRPQLTLSHDQTQLTINNIGTHYLDQEYWCNVTTSAGTSSFHSTIIRAFEPRATIEPQIEIATVGGDTHFTCHVQHGTPPTLITWAHEGSSNLPPGARINNKDVLNLFNVSSEHQGTYSCTVSNQWGSVTVNATLNVQVPPHVTIEDTPDMIELSSGDTGPELRCVATGNPPPEVNWTYRNGDNDNLPDGITISLSGSTATLTWSRPVRHTDAGVYQCEATNSLGTVDTITYLTINDSPVITDIEPRVPTTTRGPSDTYFTPTGQSGFIVSCTAFGVPPPEVKWVTSEGSSLPDHVTSVASSSGSPDPNHVTALLEWGRNFNTNDDGDYKCVATNSAGSISRTVTLNIAPPGNEVFIQLRILRLSCSHWQVSSALEDLTLQQLHTAVLSSLKSQCQCQLDDSNLISESVSCSGVVNNSSLYRARLFTVGDYTASDVFDVLTTWMTDNEDGPFITLNNTQYKIDTSCQVMAASVNQSECSPVVSSAGSSSSNDNNTIVYGAAGLGALIVICLILIVILVVVLWRRRNSSFNFSRTLGKHIRNTLYISNSFQAQLNHLGQSTIDARTIEHNDGTGDDVPHHYEMINDFPNKSRKGQQPDQSPRLSSESHGTADSGIHSRTHSCDRLTAQVSQSDVQSSHASSHVSSRVSTHRLLAYSKSEEMSLSPVHDESPHIQTPVQHRQPSFDELRYMSGVQMIDDEKQPRLSYCSENQHLSHSQPLEMLDYPNHKYVFSDQRSSHSHLSQSASQLPQYKRPPEPYVEPVSFRSSLHSILGQSSQLDTMV